MAVTASIGRDGNQGVNESGNRRRIKAVISYVSETHSNGYALPKSLFGYQVVIESIVVLDGSPADSDMYKWDEANQTIRIYTESAGTFAELTSSLTRSITVEAIGY